jgi:hypothetical protein
LRHSLDAAVEPDAAPGSEATRAQRSRMCDSRWRSTWEPSGDLERLQRELCVEAQRTKHARTTLRRARTAPVHPSSVCLRRERQRAALRCRVSREEARFGREEAGAERLLRARRALPTLAQHPAPAAAQSRALASQRCRCSCCCCGVERRAEWRAVKGRRACRKEARPRWPIVLACAIAQGSRAVRHRSSVPCRACFPARSS